MSCVCFIIIRMSPRKRTSVVEDMQLYNTVGFTLTSAQQKIEIESL